MASRVSSPPQSAATESTDASRGCAPGCSWPSARPRRSISWCPSEFGGPVRSGGDVKGCAAWQPVGPGRGVRARTAPCACWPFGRGGLVRAHGGDRSPGGVDGPRLCGGLSVPEDRAVPVLAARRCSNMTCLICGRPCHAQQKVCGGCRSRQWPQADTSRSRTEGGPGRLSLPGAVCGGRGNGEQGAVQPTFQKNRCV